MENKFKIGYLPLSKVNWTNDTLEAARAGALAFLQQLPGVEVLGGTKMLTLEDEAVAQLAQFEAEQPDLLITHFLTFALGVVPPLYAQRLKTPVILWSMKEPDPQGGRLQNNSFCAANMTAHHMWRLRIPYFHVHAEPGTPEAAAQLQRSIRVAQAMKMLGRLRIGLIGGRVPGFYTSCCSEMLLRRKLGPEVKIITEHELFSVADSLSAAEVAEATRTILADAPCHPTDGPRGNQLEKSARIFGAVRKLKDSFLVDTFALRCWPEIIRSDLYGIAACSTIGHLTNHGLITACEGDVYGAVMMRIAQQISGELPFFCDMIVMEGEYGVAWHCGAAPSKLCKADCQPELRCSATIEGGGVKGVTNEFPLKPGRVTLARLGETRDGDGFRMLVATGEGLDTELFVRGNPLKIKFDAGCEALREEVIDRGWEHHYALMYGDQTQALKDLCRNLDIQATIIN
jgi:L-fucose isomerase-like protein